MKKSLLSGFAVLAVGATLITAAPTQAAVSATNGGINVGSAELVASDPQLPFTMDGSFANLKTGPNTVETWVTDFTTTYHYTGTPENPLATKLADATINMNGFAGVGWLVNIYDAGNGTLIGMSHRESDTFSPNCAFFLGLMKSTDGGKSWTYLGDVVAPQVNGSQTYNVGGAPYLIVGNYLYVYFNEHTSGGRKRLGVARTPLPDLLTAVSNNTVPAFVKYAGGTWTQSGLTGVADNIIPNGETTAGNTQPDMHSDAAYSRALGKYILTVQTHGQGKLLLFTSSDGVTWGEQTTIDETDSNNYIQAYSSIYGLDDSANDGHEVGSDFYIYYPRKDWPNNYSYDELYRRRIVISSSGTVDEYRAADSFTANQQGAGAGRISRGTGPSTPR